MPHPDQANVKVVETYFEHLEDGRFEEAAAQFTEDTVYYHPPSFEENVRFEGRDELLAYFTDVRGEQDISHEVERSVVDGDSCAVMGPIWGEDVPGEENYFVSYVEVADGKIRFYLPGMLYQ